MSVVGKSSLISRVNKGTNKAYVLNIRVFYSESEVSFRIKMGGTAIWFKNKGSLDLKTMQNRYGCNIHKLISRVYDGRVALGVRERIGLG
jgi:hypothetical protein